MDDLGGKPMIFGNTHIKFGPSSKPTMFGWSRSVGWLIVIFLRYSAMFEWKIQIEGMIEVYHGLRNKKWIAIGANITKRLSKKDAFIFLFNKFPLL